MEILTKKSAHSCSGIASREKIRNHRDRAGTGREHVRRIISIDATNRDDRQTLGCGPGRGRSHRLEANRLVAGRLGVGAVDRPDRHVVDGLPERAIELFGGMSGKPDDRLRSKNGADLRRRQILLPDVHARRAAEPGNIGAIVHDDRGAARRRQGDDCVRRLEDVTSREVLRTDLQQPRPAGQTRRRIVDECPAGPFADVRITNDVKRRQFEVCSQKSEA